MLVELGYADSGEDMEWDRLDMLGAEKPRLLFLRSVLEGRRDGALDPSPRRLMTLDALDGFSGSPRIGADVVMGDPGATATAAREEGDCVLGEL